MLVATIVDRFVTAVPPWFVYFLVFLGPALESSMFLGFIFPGETVVVLGGVLAFENQVSLAGVLVLAVLGAVIGDSIGYWVGHRFGDPLRRTRFGKLVPESKWESAMQFLRRWGGPAVFLGRYTALLRALVPAAAGMSHLPYGTFFIWNVIGGASWAISFTLLGYITGDAYRRVEAYAGRGGLVLVGLIVLALVIRHFWIKGRDEPSE